MKKSITAAMTRRMIIIDMKKIKTPQRPLFSKAKKGDEEKRRKDWFYLRSCFEQEPKDEAGCSFGRKEWEEGKQKWQIWRLRIYELPREQGQIRPLTSQCKIHRRRARRRFDQKTRSIHRPLLHEARAVKRTLWCIRLRLWEKVKEGERALATYNECQHFGIQNRQSTLVDSPPYESIKL